MVSKFSGNVAESEFFQEIKYTIPMQFRTLEGEQQL